MKVLLFSPGFKKYVIELANALSERGHEVVVMLPGNTVNQGERESISKKVVFEAYTKPRDRDPRCILMVNYVRKTIKKHDPDIIHLMAHGHFWFFLLFPFIKKYPVVNTLHDVTSHLGQERWSYRVRIRFGLKHSARFLVHGKYLKKQMMELQGVLGSKVTVIPKGNYAYFSKFYDPAISEDPGTVLFFGRLLKYKGLEYLIKAEPFVSKEIPDFKVIAAVHGDPFSDYEHFVVNRERFEIIEQFIPDEDVAALFQKSCLVVLPYVEASQTGIVHIAFPLRRPVVVTNVGALPETVEDGGTGLVVPPKDAKALAEALIKLLKNPELRREMGEKAYNYAFTELSWENVARVTEDIYREVLDERTRAA